MRTVDVIMAGRVALGDAQRLGGRKTGRTARPWDIDRAARDRVYTPSSCVADVEAYLRCYAERSARARERLLWLTLRYGPDSAEVLHIFRAPPAAMCLLEGWLPAPLRPSDVIRGATLLSGVYELEPLRRTYIGEAIGLGVDEAARNSPVRHLHPGLPPLIVARGTGETAAFADEHDELVTTAAQLGVPVVDLVLPGHNHVDLPLSLGDPEHELGRAVLTQLGLCPVREQV